MGKARKRARAVVLESMKKDLQHMIDRPVRGGLATLVNAGHAKASAVVVDTCYGRMSETKLHARIHADSIASMDLCQEECVRRRTAEVEAYAAGGKLAG